ncbi:PH domain-containing protein [Natronosporangium hydrolyticum]|uniref:PH domain-containing protein n=1 Tax=Natronosporangium hydrolyticum TaxID=2811111 RepID=A0A895Y5U8_9ACTN|nr:PH domain-containing protein [Natronosporangium hydrolyticum]QSB13097.1 PH domain-containing protein [Natronosporangium hydrolyticum]
MTESTAPPADQPPTRAPHPRLSPLDPWPNTVVWRPVSRRLIVVELLRFAVWVTFLVLMVLLAGTFGWPFVAATFWVLAAYTLLRGTAIVRAVFAWGYAERERDLLVRHGLLLRRLSIVPYARMQFVDVTAGPLERLFNLATVQLHTAAAATDARVPGLPPDEASRLRDRLAALGEDLGEGL